jgi:hypothetical protein
MVTLIITTIQTKRIHEKSKLEKFKCSEIKCSILQVVGRFTYPKTKYSENDKILLKLSALFHFLENEVVHNRCTIKTVDKNNHFSCFRLCCENYRKKQKYFISVKKNREIYSSSKFILSWIEIEYFYLLFDRIVKIRNIEFMNYMKKKNIKVNKTHYRATIKKHISTTSQIMDTR